MTRFQFVDCQFFRNMVLIVLIMPEVQQFSLKILNSFETKNLTIKFSMIPVCINTQHALNV